MISNKISAVKDKYRILEFQRKLSEQEYIIRAIDAIALALTLSLRKREISIHEGQE